MRLIAEREGKRCGRWLLTQRSRRPMARQQLPPQIKKIKGGDRKTGKSVVRYQVTVDTGINPQTGRH